MAFFVIFSRFFENVYSAYTPVFFAVKGGSHPGKNPPIYTVLNAAFSCVKTLCRGSQCTTRARPSGETKIFFQKNIFSTPPENFCPHKNSKKIFFIKKNFFYFFKKYFLEKNFLKIFFFEKNFFLFFKFKKSYFLFK